MSAEFKLVWVEDELGMAEPTLKMTGGDWLPAPEDLLKAIADCIAGHNVHPTRLDLSIMNGGHLMGLKVVA